MEAPAPAPWPALGVLLIRDGLVSREELEVALAEQGDGRDRRVSGQRLGEALVERGVVTSEQVARLVAEQHELPYVDLDESDAIGPVATRLPEELARRCSALPLRLFPDGSLLVAVADPGRLAYLDDIRRALGVRVRWAVAAPDAIAAAIEVAGQTMLRQAEEEESRTDVVEEVAGEHALEPESPSEPVARSSQVEADTERRPVLGSLLLRDGLVTEEELDAALAQQRLSSTRRLGEILVARGALSGAQISRALAEQHELPFVDLQEHDIDMTAGALLPVELARHHSALPVSYLPDGSVLVVVADPTSAIHDEELRAELGVPVQYAVAALAEIQAAITAAVEAEHQAPQIEIVDAASIGAVAEEESPSATDAERRPFALVPALETDVSGDGDVETEDQDGEPEPVSAVLATVRQALSLGASVIHFAPRPPGMIVQGRIDGVVRKLATLPDTDRVTDELGRLAGVDIAHTTRTHHSRVLPVWSGDSMISMQADVLPTTLGARVTLRVVDDVTPRQSLSDLFTDPDWSTAIQNAMAERRGMLAVCGPPGSGRTTTLYAALLELNTPERNVLTIEDPVDDHIEGLEQMEVDAAAGLTVTGGLRAIFRSDPDIVAVGELVDREPTRVAMRGARGTLVLTTLVAPTASAGIRRLSDLHGDPGLVSEAVTSIAAQQLVRKTCLACRETYYATLDELSELGLPVEESGRLLGRGRGCGDCGGRGYQGRTSLVEVLPLTDQVRALVADGASAADIERVAVAAGIRTLREHGIGLCLEGVITTAELRRVVTNRAE